MESASSTSSSDWEEELKIKSAFVALDKENKKSTSY